MRLTVSDGKQDQDGQAVDAAVVMPTAVVTSNAAERKFLTKKRIITAVVTVLVTAIVVIGILVGIWIFTQQTNMVLQYKMNLVSNDNTKASQDVSTNKDENIVQYHVVKDDAEWWIVEDFNKNLKVAKVKDQHGVMKCLVSGLDEALATKPADVSAPTKEDQKALDAASVSEMMTVAENPVKDSSFLSKTASNLCANTPVYWTYKTCINETAVSDSPAREKRLTLYCAPCGCGYRVCIACGSVTWYYWFDGRYWHCSWNVRYCTGYSYYVYYC